MDEKALPGAQGGEGGIDSPDGPGSPEADSWRVVLEEVLRLSKVLFPILFVIFLFLVARDYLNWGALSIDLNMAYLTAAVVLFALGWAIPTAGQSAEPGLASTWWRALFGLAAGTGGLLLLLGQIQGLGWLRYVLAMLGGTAIYTVSSSPRWGDGGQDPKGPS